MHFADGRIPAEYRRHTARKTLMVAATALTLLVALIHSLATGAAGLPLRDVWQGLFGATSEPHVHAIVWSIRLPQALAAVFAGMGLSSAGTVMQSVLRNPLGAPFTLGLSHAAAFGAAVSVMLLGGGSMHSTGGDAVVIASPYLTTISAFVMSLLATFVILGISRLRNTSPEVMVLTGVALGSLFTAGTMLLQYFADDVQLAAMVFWTFGDTARANWSELAVMAGILLPVLIFFAANRWNYNAIDAGDETAKGLGVRVERVRLLGMLAACLITAVITAFLGIIGFMGLICPHMVRRFTGDDHRFLLPGAALFGGLLLLLADTAARTVLSPHALPVSVLTAFIGAPVFLWLVMRRRQS